MAIPMITNWKKIDASKDKEVDPILYRERIGSLMYLVNTRPDICFAVNTLSQFMVEPKRAHMATTRHILRYVRGTVGYGLKYTRGDDVRLSGFTNADWAGSSVDRKKYLRVLLQHWIRNDLFVQQEAKVTSNELNRSRIYGSQHSYMRSHMAQEIAGEFVQEENGRDQCLL